MSRSFHWLTCVSVSQVFQQFVGLCRIDGELSPLGCVCVWVSEWVSEWVEEWKSHERFYLQNAQAANALFTPCLYSSQGFQSRACLRLLLSVFAWGRPDCFWWRLAGGTWNEGYAWMSINLTSRSLSSRPNWTRKHNVDLSQKIHWLF